LAKGKIIKTLIKSTVVTLALGFTVLYASNGGHSHSHEGHGHSHSHEHSALEKKLNSTDIQKIAKQEVKRLVLEKKIPKSWKSMPISKLGKSQDGYSNDWVIVFENEKIKKKKRQTLYIFVDLYGDVTGANYTGK